MSFRRSERYRLRPLAEFSCSLTALLAGVKFEAVNAIDFDVQVTDITLDSRNVCAGGVFLAVKGSQSDGRNYIEQAVASGATVVIAEAENGFVLPDIQVPLLLVPNLAASVSLIAGNFYQHPSAKMKVFGVTGTNGKTTCVQLLQQLFSILGEAAASIGTMGYGFDTNTLIDTGLTTPDAISCQRILAQLYGSGARNVAMEVSSHALAQGRVNAIQFNGAVFTNLSRDHLDFHASIDEYRQVKTQLFSHFELAFAIINSDDTAAPHMAKSCGTSTAIYGYSLGVNRVLNLSESIRGSNLVFGREGVEVAIESPWGNALVKAGLIGRFNVYNLLAVVATACATGYSLAQVNEAVLKLRPVKGRMQRVSDVQDEVLVCVDYAHTPDALEQALVTLEEQKQRRIWLIFGCGGDRDIGKRPLMGTIAQRLANRTLITSDNPRSESPFEIVSDIAKGIASEKSLELSNGYGRLTDSIEIILDRKVAIETAIELAEIGDIILIAGKGHESYQIVGDEKIPFDDSVIAQAALAQRAKYSVTVGGGER